VCFSFLTTMVSLMVSQGEGVQGGAAAPMMMGSLSIIIYAFLFAEVCASLLSLCLRLLLMQPLSLIQFQLAFRNHDPNATFVSASPTPVAPGQQPFWDAPDGGYLALSAFLAEIVCSFVPTVCDLD
jgi:hypothetical protein